MGQLKFYYLIHKYTEPPRDIFHLAKNDQTEVPNSEPIPQTQFYLAQNHKILRGCDHIGYVLENKVKESGGPSLLIHR